MDSLAFSEDQSWGEGAVGSPEQATESSPSRLFADVRPQSCGDGEASGLAAISQCQVGEQFGRLWRHSVGFLAGDVDSVLAE
ncbi:hypothetical protein DKG71_33425 [Streptomyces sp. NEAU-S7GS2]|nr:hypothetical protein DKG71_33425 [Streptomyces sp. NEAU-S7GS2]